MMTTKRIAKPLTRSEILPDVIMIQNKNNLYARFVVVLLRLCESFNNVSFFSWSKTINVQYSFPTKSQSFKLMNLHCER